MVENEPDIPIDEILDKTDDDILNVLKKSDTPLSTYEIAKRLGLSWGATTSHCYKLKSFGKIESRVTAYKKVLKRIMWWIKKEEEK